MPYVQSWAEFHEGAQRIYIANPGATRYSVKYRHTDEKLVLKVTDDVTCLKYKTDQAQDVKRMEKLNAELFRMMIRGLSGEVDAEEYDAARQAAVPAAVSSPGRASGGKKNRR